MELFGEPPGGSKARVERGNELRSRTSLRSVSHAAADEPISSRRSHPSGGPGAGGSRSWCQPARATGAGPEWTPKLEALTHGGPTCCVGLWTRNCSRWLGMRGSEPLAYTLFCPVTAGRIPTFGASTPRRLTGVTAPPLTRIRHRPDARASASRWMRDAWQSRAALDALTALLEKRRPRRAGRCWQSCHSKSLSPPGPPNLPATS